MEVGMIRTVHKLKVIILLIVVLLVCSGFQIRKSSNAASPGILSKEELRSKKMGGVAARMPDNSVKILFESLLGLKLSSYHSYNTIPETLTALQSDEIQAAWFSDVTADYLLRTREDLREIISPDPTKSRLDFGLAVKNSEEGNVLKENLNAAISMLKEDGTLERLTNEYVENAEKAETFTDTEMESGNYGKTLYIGVSGAVPPLDSLNIWNKPNGFSAAFMDEVGKKLEYSIQFVVLNNETMFSALMSGRIDALFCYGSSPITTESEIPYLMTEGYYTMQKYKILVQKEEDDK